MTYHHILENSILGHLGGVQQETGGVQEEEKGRIVKEIKDSLCSEDLG